MVLRGIPVGVRIEGGMLQHVLRELEISVLAANIPDNIPVDVSELDVHDSIHVEDLPEGEYDILTDPRRTIVTVIAPVVIEEPVEDEEAELAEGEEGELAEGEEDGEEKESE